MPGVGDGMSGRFFLPLAALAAAHVHAADLTPLKTAMEKQALNKTVSVDVRQTKKVPALSDSTVLEGHVWMIPGKSFLWQLGKPPVQTAVYDGEKVYLIDEARKSGLELKPDDRRAKPLLLMLGIGGTSPFNQIQEDFRVTSTNQVDDHFVVKLLPQGEVKRALTSMIIQVNTANSYLERIEWTQKDGTVVVTEFSAPVLDKPLPSGAFEVKRAAYTWE